MSTNKIPCFQLDGQDIPFESGQTIMEAATHAGVYIPHLCHHPDVSPHGSCRVCIVKVNNQVKASCITPAEDGMNIQNQCDEINALRKRLIQMLFVEGNHFCPSCELSGDCQLQALAYDLNMQDTHYDHFFPQRDIDCSHPDIVLDRDRCINCELCVRASDQVDNKAALSLGGRGNHAQLQTNNTSGKLKDTDISLNDKAMNICPVGALFSKHNPYPDITGERLYDQRSIHEQGNQRRQPHEQG